MVHGQAFTVEQTHGRVLRPGNRVISHSESSGWQSMHAAIFEEAPFQAKESAIGHPSLIYHLTRPTEVRRKIAGQRAEGTLIGPRRFCLTPGDATTTWQHSGHPEILQLYLRSSIFECAIEEMYGVEGDLAELVPRFAVLDPLLEQLAVAIVAALREGLADDRVYIESMAQMIAVHLARNHSTRSRPRPLPAADGLCPQKLRRLIEYIDAQIGGDLSLDAMAAEVGLSPFYLSRVFKARIGQSPHQYVIGRRVERAKALLRDTAIPIADVALAAGFSSQSHMSNWFRRVVGVSPAAYRRGQ